MKRPPRRASHDSTSRPAVGKAIPWVAWFDFFPVRLDSDVPRPAAATDSTATSFVASEAGARYVRSAEPRLVASQQNLAKPCKRTRSGRPSWEKPARFRGAPASFHQLERITSQGRLQPKYPNLNSRTTQSSTRTPPIHHVRTILGSTRSECCACGTAGGWDGDVAGD
jgi:hypothetical protein